MKILKNLHRTMMIAAMTILCGCETLENVLNDKESDDKPKYVVTVNQVVKYPRAKEIEREITTFTGNTIWINTGPVLHSKDIEQIKAVPSKDKQGFYDLEIKLARRGKVMWAGLQDQVKVDKFGIVIDGVYYRSFQPEKMAEEESDWVFLKGPFDQTTAQELAKNASINYKKFNKDK